MAQSQIDQFTALLSTTDTRKKITVGTDIINYLGVPTNTIESDDIGQFIDGMVPWLQSSNFKVSVILLYSTLLYISKTGLPLINWFNVRLILYSTCIYKYLYKQESLYWYYTVCFDSAGGLPTYYGLYYVFFLGDTTSIVHK